METEKPKPAVADDDDLDDLDISPEEIRKHLESQPVYIFTSLAGGMQVILRSNNLAAILQGNGIKFEYRDLGTDEEAKRFGRDKLMVRLYQVLLEEMIILVIGKKSRMLMKNTD